jgi:hypothetical protein
MPSLKQVALRNWIEVAISLIETHTNETKDAFSEIRSGRGAVTGLAKLDNSLTLSVSMNPSLPPVRTSLLLCSALLSRPPSCMNVSGEPFWLTGFQKASINIISNQKVG